MTDCRGFTGEHKERTYFATRLNIFHKVKRASGGFKHLIRQCKWWCKSQGLISLQLVCPFLSPYLRRLSEHCWIKVGLSQAQGEGLFPGILSGHVRKQLTARSTLPTTPSQTFQQGFRTYHLIPNSIFLNTAWNKPSISQQQLAEDQAGPLWLELWWKQMRVRISENLSSFRPSLTLTLFSL